MIVPQLPEGVSSLKEAVGCEMEVYPFEKRIVDHGSIPAEELVSERTA